MIGMESNLSKAALNIPMPSNVKPPRSEATCDNCEHAKVCRYSENMKTFKMELAEITDKYEFDMFEIEIKCKHRKFYTGEKMNNYRG